MSGQEQDKLWRKMRIWLLMDTLVGFFVSSTDPAGWREVRSEKQVTKQMFSSGFFSNFALLSP
jgi:hypothetical protein